MGKILKEHHYILVNIFSKYLIFLFQKHIKSRDVGQVAHVCSIARGLVPIPRREMGRDKVSHTKQIFSIDWVKKGIPFTLSFHFIIYRKKASLKSPLYTDMFIKIR